MDTTPNLALPYIMAAQAQKHVTHNEALRELDAIVQLMVLDKDLATPPGSPANGARYIVAGSPTGAWSGQAGKIAAYQDGTWAFYAPQEGWLAWVGDENTFYAYDGAAWGAMTVAASVNPVPMVGVNATADTTNRLSVASTASLFSHAGNGHQHKINKNAAGDTASVLFQTNSSGRAEFGTTGDDNFHVKVSPDGSTWNEAIVVDKTAASVSFPRSSFAPCVPGGRVSLVTGTPVMTASQAAKTTLYYALWQHRFVPVYNGTILASVDIGGELSCALDSNSGHTGYHQSGKSFDVFCAYVSGTLYFGTGPAWSNDTTAPARSAALTQLQGIWVNNSTMTLRYGSSSGNTVSVPANQATYLGTIRASADGQTQYVFGANAAGGTAGSFLVWNMYNRVDVASVTSDSTNSWNVSAGTIQAGNNSSTMRCNFVMGMQEDAIFAEYTCTGQAGASSSFQAGVGLDSTSAFVSGGSIGYGVSTVATLRGAHASTQIGFHYYSAIESAQGTNPATFNGDNGVAYLQNGLIVRLRA